MDLEQLARARNQARKAFAAAMDQTAAANNGDVVCGPDMPGWAALNAAEKALAAALDAVGV
jgi:hypothetical protein